MPIADLNINSLDLVRRLGQSTHGGVFTLRVPMAVYSPARGAVADDCSSRVDAAGGGLLNRLITDRAAAIAMLGT